MSDLQMVMSFELNGNTYRIYLADIINDDNNIMGYTLFTENVVYIKRNMQQAQELRTLRHELTHIWLYEYGHNQHDENKTFNFEDICEIVACSHDYIAKMTKMYLDAKLNK